MNNFEKGWLNWSAYWQSVLFYWKGDNGYSVKTLHLKKESNKNNRWVITIFNAIASVIVYHGLLKAGLVKRQWRPGSLPPLNPPLNVFKNCIQAYILFVCTRLFIRTQYYKMVFENYLNVLSFWTFICFMKYLSPYVLINIESWIFLSRQCTFKQFMKILRSCIYTTYIFYLHDLY